MNSWLENAVSLFDSDNFNDGDVISHDWLKYALEVPEPKGLDEVEEIQWMWLTRIESFKEWLLVERKIAMKSIRGDGYWIVPPDDQAMVAASTAMKGIKKGLDKGNKLLANARIDQMSVDAKRRHTDAQIRLSGIRQLMKREKTNFFDMLESD